MASLPPDHESAEPVAFRAPWRRSLGLGFVIVVSFLLGFLLARSPLTPSNDDTRPAICAILSVQPRPRDVFTNRPGESASEVETTSKTIVQLIKSHRVLASVLKNSNVAQLPSLESQRDPLSWLASRLQVEVRKDTSLIFISSNGMNPKEQAWVANTVAEEFLRAQAEWADDSARTEISRLVELKKRLDNRLTELQSSYVELAGRLDKEENGKNETMINAKMKLLEYKLRSQEEVCNRCDMALEQLHLEARSGNRALLIGRAVVPSK